MEQAGCYRVVPTISPLTKANKTDMALPSRPAINTALPRVVPLLHCCHPPADFTRTQVPTNAPAPDTFHPTRIAMIVRSKMPIQAGNHSIRLGGSGVSPLSGGISAAFLWRYADHFDETGIAINHTMTASPYSIACLTAASGDTLPQTVCSRALLSYAKHYHGSTSTYQPLRLRLTSVLRGQLATAYPSPSVPLHGVWIQIVTEPRAVLGPRERVAQDLA